MQGSLAGQRVQPFVAARSGARQAARAGPAVHARYTDGGSGNDRRLIMPGQENQGGNRRPLVVPGQGGGQRPPSGGSVGQGLVGTGGPPVQMQSFRPPPGFMDMDGPAVEDSGLSTEEMLDRLRSLRGHWHQLAKLLPHLARAGYDAFAVEDASGAAGSMGGRLAGGLRVCRLVWWGPLSACMHWEHSSTAARPPGSRHRRASPLLPAHPPPPRRPGAQDAERVGDGGPDLRQRVGAGPAHAGRA